MRKVLIDESVLYGLIHDSILLGHLENQGVDNWTGYYHPENLDESTEQLLKEIKDGQEKSNSN